MEEPEPDQRAQRLAGTGDPRGADIAFKALSDLHSARCTLATPVWDYRLAAADTLSSLGQSARGHELVAGRFQRALADNELHGVFSSLQLMVALGDARTRATFPVLNLRLGSDANAMKAIEDFENQLNDKLKVR